MTHRSLRNVGIATVLLLVALAATIWWLNVRGDHDSHPVPTAQPATAERGAYLARAGNCAGCHTRAGGAAYAGGLGVATPFGTVFSTNLTPDPDTGIGQWTADDFWRALHNGRSRDGRFLTPVFPYPNYTQINRADSDALYAFLKDRPAAQQPNRAHELRFPYSGQWALAIWRALFFRPGVYEVEGDQSAEWNRGAYLVRGLGHCDACHASRNALGATRGGFELSGGLIPLQKWYAPSLARAGEASVASWPTDQVVALLKNGVSAHGSVTGPMASVVYESTQFLNDADLRAMAVFLQALPQDDATAKRPTPPDAASMQRGADLYIDQCAGCHGAEGQGAGRAYPPLAGNRSVTMTPASNLVRVIVEGGFAPATEGNPRPYGMPPFGQSLTPAQIADVATYVRNAWGNAGGGVSELDLLLLR